MAFSIFCLVLAATMFCLGRYDSSGAVTLRPVGVVAIRQVSNGLEWEMELSTGERYRRSIEQHKSTDWAAYPSGVTPGVRRLLFCIDEFRKDERVRIWKARNQ